MRRSCGCGAVGAAGADWCGWGALPPPETLAWPAQRVRTGVLGSVRACFPALAWGRGPPGRFAWLGGGWLLVAVRWGQQGRTGAVGGPCPRRKPLPGRPSVCARVSWVACVPVFRLWRGGGARPAASRG